EVALVAPAGALDLPVGPEGELAQHPGGVAGGAHLGPDRVVGQVVGGQVAEVLVQPVGGEAAGDPLVPPRPAAHVLDPGGRGVPVVADVVGVGDHGRGQRGQ